MNCFLVFRLVMYLLGDKFIGPLSRVPPSLPYRYRRHRSAPRVSSGHASCGNRLFPPSQPSQISLREVFSFCLTKVLCRSLGGFFCPLPTYYHSYLLRHFLTTLRTATSYSLFVSDLFPRSIPPAGTGAELYRREKARRGPPFPG